MDRIDIEYVGDRMDKRGAELTGLLNQIKLAILFIFD